MTSLSPYSDSQVTRTLRTSPSNSYLPSPATCCHGDKNRLLLRLWLESQEAGEAKDRAGQADGQPSPVQGPRAAPLRVQAAGPIRRGGEGDVSAYLAVWGGGAPGVPPEGSLQGARGVCEIGEEMQL